MVRVCHSGWRIYRCFNIFGSALTPLQIIIFHISPRQSFKIKSTSDEYSCRSATNDTRKSTSGTSTKSTPKTCM